MKKDKKNQVKPEGKIKHILRTNYWLTPLLLVALVFAIVFGISKIPAIKTTIQGWFHSHEKCKECEQVSFEEFQNSIKDNDKTIFVLFSEADNEDAKALFPKLDKYLKTNKESENITIISVDLTKKDEFIYNDKTIKDDDLDKLKQQFKDTLDKGAFTTPTIIKYNSQEMIDAIVGNKEYKDIKDFFESNN